MSPVVTWLGTRGQTIREHYVLDDFADNRAAQLRRTLGHPQNLTVRVIPDSSLDDAPAPRCPNTLDLFSTTTGEDSAA